MSSPPPNKAAGFKYRPDIDGLRAVAVLLVIAAHLRTHVTGGYVGVDLFFVISGYLISAHILTEMRQGRFSIVSFYERRIRRIFPALIVVLLATTALGYRYLFPAELRDYAVSMLAAMFSYSNMLFWHQAGYFDAPSLLKPLLHTWSLAVEEQFYLVFPVFLYLIRKTVPGQLKAAIWAVTLGTFGLAVWCVHRDPTAAFYFAPLRAWELLIGTILSQGYLPRIERAISRHTASVAGLLLIAVPALRYTDVTPFPGLAALPPCLGAALLIAAGETGPSIVGRVLSLRPVVFVGLISYSLYLWHWPILVFQKIGGLLGTAPEESHGMKLAVFAVSLLMGTLSWALVETPFRKGRFRPGREAMFAINGAGTLLVAGLGFVILIMHGVPRRFSPEALQVASFIDQHAMAGPYLGGECFIRPTDEFSDFKPDQCLHARVGEKNYLLMGDSQAAHLWPGLRAVYPAMNLSTGSIAICKPFLPYPPQMRPACTQLTTLLDRYMDQHRIDVILLAGRWEPEDEPKIGEFIAAARQRGTEVVLVGPMMEYDAVFPRLLASSMREGDAGSVERHRLKGEQVLDGELARMARDVWHVRYISIYGDLCTPGCPSFAAPGVPMLFDSHHFTPEGSVVLARVMKVKGQIP